MTNAAGLLPGDRDVMFKPQGSYAFPYDIVVSSNWQWVAGKAYTRRLSVGNLPQGTQTVFLQPRDVRAALRILTPATGASSERAPLPLLPV